MGNRLVSPDEVWRSVSDGLRIEFLNEIHATLDGIKRKLERNEWLDTEDGKLKNAVRELRIVVMEEVLAKRGRRP